MLKDQLFYYNAFDILLQKYNQKAFVNFHLERLKKRQEQSKKNANDGKNFLIIKIKHNKHT